MARIIGEVGPLTFTLRRERFEALTRTIIFQQLAGAAANAIYNRFVAMYPDVKFPSAAQVLATADADMRKVGLSERKALYIKDLAAHVADGEINFGRFPRMSDEEIIEHLTRVKGIGRWTAEIFLMFNLGRPDVMPADDLGIQAAVHRHYKMRARPNRKKLLKHAERWRPYRSAAAWYMWRSLDMKTPDTAVTSKKKSKAPKSKASKPAAKRKSK